MEMIRQYLDGISAAARATPVEPLVKLIDALDKAYREDRFVFVIGNGGSASNSSHFAEDLCKGCLEDTDRKRFRVLSLTDNTSFITAIANDLGYDRIFEFQLRQFSRPGDVLIAISGSGNSPNVIRAAQYALDQGLVLAGITGFGGGALHKMAHIGVNVPLNDMCQSEAVHAMLMHVVTEALRRRWHPSTPTRP